MKEKFFYVRVPSIYGNRRKDKQLSRHRIGAIKIFNENNEVFITGSLIANKIDKFDRNKAHELINERVKKKIKTIKVDLNKEYDIRDVIRECGLCKKNQDINLLMSPIFKVKSVVDINGLVNVIKNSEEDCLEENNNKLNKLIKACL